MTEAGAVRTARSVDLADEATRSRLSPSALKALSEIVDRWRLHDTDVRGLLGQMPEVTDRRRRAKSERPLDEETLTRLSCFIGIFRALGRLYGEPLADEWIRLPNRNSIFGGRTPLDFMTAGGLPALQTVRRLLDARCNG